MSFSDKERARIGHVLLMCSNRHLVWYIGYHCIAGAVFSFLGWYLRVIYEFLPFGDGQHLPWHAFGLVFLANLHFALAIGVLAAVFLGGLTTVKVTVDARCVRQLMGIERRRMQDDREGESPHSATDSS